MGPGVGILLPHIYDFSLVLVIIWNKSCFLFGFWLLVFFEIFNTSLQGF